MQSIVPGCVPSAISTNWIRGKISRCLSQFHRCVRWCHHWIRLPCLQGLSKGILKELFHVGRDISIPNSHPIPKIVPALGSLILILLSSLDLMLAPLSPTCLSQSLTVVLVLLWGSFPALWTFLQPSSRISTFAGQWLFNRKWALSWTENRATHVEIHETQTSHCLSSFLCSCNKTLTQTNLR